MKSIAMASLVVSLLLWIGAYCMSESREQRTVSFFGGLLMVIALAIL
jgi:hypothetical protein